MGNICNDRGFYISAICFAACIIAMAAEKRSAWLYIAATSAIFLFAFIRPTGWILPPAAAITWICLSKWKRRWRFLAAFLVIATFLAIAFGAPGARGGIEGQGPVAKLYSGEVVWQEDLWRVNMPPVPADSTSFKEAAIYALRHFPSCAWLAIKRVAVMFLKVRPGYSAAHNALLLAAYIPLLILGCAGFCLHRAKPEAQVAIVVIFAHALVVALTFNDNDGRFTLYITPLMSMLAASALAHIIPAKFLPVSLKEQPGNTCKNYTAF